MEQKTSNFQIIILLVFGFFIILSVILFATSKVKQSTDVTVTPVVMWGTVSGSTVDAFLRALLEKEKDSLKITYIEKDPRNFQQNLIEAIADGAGPDIVILPQDMVLKNINKFTVLPYESYPLRNFKDQFVDAGSVYLNTEGVMALPFIIDPMVMYWNKTQFVNAGIINPPVDWTEFSKVVSKLTNKDSNFNVLHSGTALGEYQNIDHAKDILSMLFMQAGVPIVAKNNKGGYESALLNNTENKQSLADFALTFYTDFANPSKDNYSWNKSLNSSLTSFIAGDTSTYFGFASELPSISLKNPNLNFDVAKVPQVAVGDSKKSVFAKIYGLAVLKSSKNQTSAFTQIFKLVSKDSIVELSTLTNLPPVRKDALVGSATDLYMKTFYDSALIADTWMDPDSSATEFVFKNMIESVIIGKNNSDIAISKADGEIENIIRTNVKSE
jgi:ABC-type glycerol-3-phosphate transport system substrate-binding protein